MAERLHGPFRYTLVTDGASDRALIPILNWVLGRVPAIQQVGFVDQLAELRDLRDPPKALAGRMERAVEDFPCDLLFVHRDAEGEAIEERVTEISRAAAQVAIGRHVPIVPVRMTEAWLLIDERAIRHAAGNPNGTAALDLPPLERLESEPDPKRALMRSLEQAAQKQGRRLQQFRRDIHRRRSRVADYIEDFSPLYALDAFRRFSRETETAIEDIDRSSSTPAS